MKFRAIAVAMCCLVLATGQLLAQSGETNAPAPAKPVMGPVSRLPLPRFVSLKASIGNVRRGPSRTHRVDWVFTRANMPLQIIAEYENWRRVRDMDGAGGWMHYTLLSGTRTVFVLKDYTPLRLRPEVGSDPNAYAEHGVIARLGSCVLGWCEVSADGHDGWVLPSEIWGVDQNDFED